MLVYVTQLAMLLYIAIRSNYLLCQEQYVTSNLVNVKFVNTVTISIKQVQYVTIMGAS